MIIIEMKYIFFFNLNLFKLWCLHTRTELKNRNRNRKRKPKTKFTFSGVQQFTTKIISLSKRK